MHNKLNIYLFLGVCLLLMTWLFVGISYDDEFAERNLFTKHKPNFKVKFYSPIGQSGLTYEDLTSEQQLEENTFREFVKNQDRQSIPPEIFIQLTLTFLCLGIYQSRRNISFKIWQVLVCFLLNFVITLFGGLFILDFHPMFISVLIIIGINYLSLSFLVKRGFYPQK